MAPGIADAHQVVAYRATGLTQHRRDVMAAVRALRAALAARHRADVRFAQEDLDDALDWLRTGWRRHREALAWLHRVEGEARAIAAPVPHIPHPATLPPAPRALLLRLAASAMPGRC